MKTQLALALWVLTLSLGCEHADISTEPSEMPAPADPDPQPTIFDRGILMSPCRGGAVFPDLSGGWAFAIETRDTRVGMDGVSQVEVSSRYGVARLCQDGDQLHAQMLLCTYAQSPVRHDDGQCAAYLPQETLLTVLTAQTMRGQLDRIGLGAELTLDGWDERWGYREAADDEAFDHDGDGASGATLISDVTPDQVRHVRRSTRLSMQIEVLDDNRLQGTVIHTTDEQRLGPADRSESTLSRASLMGGVGLVRADGRDGRVNIDFDGDGVVRCAELGPLLGRTLPAPADGGACTR